MTDKIEELIERLRHNATMKRADNADAILMDEAADALTTLRTQRNEVIEECARVASAWTSSLRPGSLSRLHGHREAARDIATAIRNLKSQDEPR